MKNLLLLTAVLLMNVGCLALVKRIKGPDGSEQLLITCRAINDCYEAARKNCGSDFIVVDRFYSTAYGEDTYIELQIKCKADQSEDPYIKNLKAEVNSMEPEFRKCLEDFVKKNDTATNYEISLEWTVDENGRAKNLKAVEKTFSSPEAKVCMSDLISNKVFSKPKEGPRMVKKTFILLLENNGN